jgi:hypothetical protein
VVLQIVNSPAFQMRRAEPKPAPVPAPATNPADTRTVQRQPASERAPKVTLSQEPGR